MHTRYALKSYKLISFLYQWNTKHFLNIHWDLYNWSVYVVLLEFQVEIYFLTLSNDEERENLLVLFVLCDRHALRQHMMRHNGKQYKCGLPGCLTSLRTETELKNHRLRVHGNPEQMYQCIYCSYSAKLRWQLVRYVFSKFLLIAYSS